MNETVRTVFGLAGGLALFLFGMNSMSDALQKAAGAKMKKVLAFLTRNPVMGALAGALVTAILQSSSATTVMVIGFTSAGLMTLPQAISVIFGANIGTTMTAQLLAFKISDYIYPIIFAGFLISFLAKREKVRNVGLVIFSFGLLFEGIEIMGSVMKPLASSPFFIEMMGRVKDIPVLGVLLGCGMTLVVQSSSATIAVLQNFAATPGPDGGSVIGLVGAIPILLGDNIGTTITALLASIGQSKNAKRTAIAHSFFNISGTIVFMFLIPWFARFVAWISPRGAETDIISRQIANAHTTFNVICTLVWLPLLPLMVKLVMKVIPGAETAARDAYRPEFLDESLISQPVAAMYLVGREIRSCASHTDQMLEAARDELGAGTAADRSVFDGLYRNVESVQAAIIRYISKMFAGGGLTETQAEQTAGLMSVASDLGRIGDRCGEIVMSLRKIGSDDRSFSTQAVSELTACFNISLGLFRMTVDAIEQQDLEKAAKVSRGRKKMRKAQKQFNKAHLARISAKECDPSMTADYSGILDRLNRIVDNCVDIAEDAMDRVTLPTLDGEEAEKPAAAAAGSV